MRLIATPLGWIMKACYHLVKNYGMALLLFTIITRIITLPLQIKQQKSTARMNMIQPELDKLKTKYGKNQEKLNEETMKLYSEYQINPMASCLPMVISLVILWALIPVVYGPLTYVSDADENKVSHDNTMVKNLYVISNEVDTSDIKSMEAFIQKQLDEEDKDTALADLSDEKKTALEKNMVKALSDKKTYKDSAALLDKLSDGDQQELMEKFIDFDGLDKFLTNKEYFTANVVNSSYGPEVLLFNFESKEDGKYFNVLDENVRNAISDYDYTFLGMELGKIPTKADATVVIPFISFILQLATTIISQIFARKNNPAMKLNGSMLMMLILMPVFSLWIGFKFPCALGIYWIYSSLFAVFQVIFLNLVYSPAKLEKIAAKETEKAKAKRKKKGPSFMERAIEIRNEQGSEMPKPSDAKKKRVYADDNESDDAEPEKLSKSKQKDLNRQKLNEARKKYAEKYGDEYTED